MEKSWLLQSSKYPRNTSNNILPCTIGRLWNLHWSIICWQYISLEVRGMVALVSSAVKSALDDIDRTPTVEIDDGVRARFSSILFFIQCSYSLPPKYSMTIYFL